MEIYEATWGSRHPIVAKTLIALSEVQRASDLVEKQIAALERALEVLGSPSSNIAGVPEMRRALVLLEAAHGLKGDRVKQRIAADKLKLLPGGMGGGWAATV